MTILTKEDYAVTYGYTYNKNGMSDLVFNFIYGCALRDAILQKAFECDDKSWVCKVQAAKITVKEYIDAVLSGRFKTPADKKDHDDLFLATANAVCAAINSARPSSCTCTFTFGNAQKLINMTVKHVYAHTYSSPAIRECFRNCHCPMDSVMLGNVWKAYKDTFNDKKRKTDLISSDSFHSAWSKEGTNHPIADIPERYEKFQKAILDIIAQNKGDIFPIEYDYIFW